MSYLTTQDVAEQYAVTRQAVKLWITRGVVHLGRTVKLKAVRLGRLWRIHPAALDEFVAAQNVEVKPADRPKLSKADRDFRKRMGV